MKRFENYIKLLGMATLVVCAAMSAVHGGMRDQISQQIKKNYSNATKIELGTPSFSSDICAQLNPESIRVTNVSDNGKGEISFTAQCGEQKVDGTVGFHAYVQAWVTQRRIHPGEIITPDAVVQQEIDVSTGYAKEVKGLILSHKIPIKNIEARQTILEGQCILSSAVQKIPDIRKGESLQMKLTSGSVTIVSNAIAEESAYIDQNLKISVAKTKRILTGKLSSEHVVEVQL